MKIDDLFKVYETLRTERLGARLTVREVLDRIGAAPDGSFGMNAVRSALRNLRKMGEVDAEGQGYWGITSRPQTLQEASGQFLVDRRDDVVYTRVMAAGGYYVILKLREDRGTAGALIYAGDRNDPAGELHAAVTSLGGTVERVPEGVHLYLRVSAPAAEVYRLAEAIAAETRRTSGGIRGMPAVAAAECRR